MLSLGENRVWNGYETPVLRFLCSPCAAAHTAKLGATWLAPRVPVEFCARLTTGTDPTRGNCAARSPPEPVRAAYDHSLRSLRRQLVVPGQRPASARDAENWFQPAERSSANGPNLSRQRPTPALWIAALRSPVLGNRRLRRLSRAAMNWEAEAAAYFANGSPADPELRRASRLARPGALRLGRRRPSCWGRRRLERR